MAAVRVLVLRAPGTNCDEETAHAWRLAGGEPTVIHVNRLIERPGLLEEHQLLTIPGGFSYGDDIASGRIFANQLRQNVGDELARFVDRGGLVLGICNGFQVLVSLGLIPGRKSDAPFTLTLGDRGRYEDRWVRCRVDTDACPMLERGETMVLPVANAEGRVWSTMEEAERARPAFQQHLAMRYVGEAGDNGAGAESSSFGMGPANPNGSIENAAGLIDTTGRVLGLMPHPERNVDKSQLPDWIAGGNTESDGLRIFRRGVAAFR
ncbi:Phosphoribosylformylglycinamidine synthase [Phycisphaerae bacterium RAS2]|nr:Phosphoribosylformylglycinamidine synthase [Phycisphaerae bacterium RAS2]